MKIHIFLIPIFFSQANCATVLSLIDSLLSQYEKSKILSAFLCEKNDAAAFLRHFSKQMHQINIFTPNTSNLPYPIPPSNTFFILDLACSESQQLLLTANNESLFAAPFKWIMYQNFPLTVEKVIEIYFSPLDILVDSDVTIAIQESQDRFTIKKIFKRHVNDAVITEDVGIWNSKSGLTGTSLEKITYIRRRDLRKTVLNTCMVITNNDSLNHLTDKRDRHIDSIAKVNYVLVEHLADTVNASLHYSIRTTWGYKDKNSKWNGMIGELTRKEADIGGTALFMTSDRIKIIDYIAMTTPTRSKFIFRQPKLSYVTNVFTLPFDGWVWASTCGLLAVTAVVLFIVVKWEWKKKTYVVARNRSNQTEIHNSWFEVFFITFGALCQQGAAASPYSFPGRITVIFLFISFMFLYTSYSANIVALLQSSSTSIQTLEDILHSRLDVGVDDTVFNHFYFPVRFALCMQSYSGVIMGLMAFVTQPTIHCIIGCITLHLQFAKLLLANNLYKVGALYLEKVAPPGQKPRFYRTEEGIRKMRKGLFAFHVETGPGYKFVSETFQEDEKCGLQEIQFLQVPDPWLAIQKNSSYKKMLKVGLRQLQENGIQAREVGLIYTKKPQCLSRGSSFISVGLVDCYPAAVVLAGGMGASVVILVLEIYLNARLKYYRRKFRRNRQ